MEVVPEVEMTRPDMFTKSPFSTNESALPVGMWCSLLCNGDCCGNDICCADNTRCCENSGLCCPFDTVCCKDGCCRNEYSTCCVSWCCKTGHNCGSHYLSCYSKGVIISPEAVALLFLVASVSVSRYL
ncbi:unnamed protein product [Larinioides sclopetarius]